MNQPKLCYIEGNWAYFTTQDVTKQWGDDWDDAPYEHNAGTPYDPCWHNRPKYINNKSRGINKRTGEPLQPGKVCLNPCCVDDWNEDGTPKWEIIKVAWEGDLVPPCFGHTNSQFSVEMINKGAVAWLRSEISKDGIIIPAGTTLEEFKLLVKKAGGNVYEITSKDSS